MEKMTRPWTGKKNSLPNPVRKEQHLSRKNKRHIMYVQEELDWELELKEYNANPSSIK